MKKLISELDRVAEFIEDLEEPWTFHVVWKLDKIAQELEEVDKKDAFRKINKDILNQYLDRMLFLSQNQKDLTSLIREHNNKEASEVYDIIKESFGKLKKHDSIEFIKNVLNVKY